MEAKRTPSRATAAAREPAAAPIRALTFVLDVACGRHALSPLIPVALWLADAVLTCLVIWKIPCGWFSFFVLFPANVLTTNVSV